MTMTITEAKAIAALALERGYIKSPPPAPTGTRQEKSPVIRAILRAAEVHKPMKAHEIAALDTKCQRLHRRVAAYIRDLESRDVIEVERLAGPYKGYQYLIKANL